MIPKYTDRFNLLVRWFIKIFHVSDEERYGRKIIAEFVADEVERESTAKILDIAAGRGTDLMHIKTRIPSKKLSLYAIEAYKPNVDVLKKINVDTALLDIERERLPFKDNFFDVVIANQVLEHCKELFWIFNEVQRILKPGGVFIIGVPNLASIHCRLMLLFGMQPPCIDILGPHVRGFTLKDFSYFIEMGGYFKVEEYKGSGHYSVIPGLSKGLARMFPKSSLTLVLKVRKTRKKGNFYDYLKEIHLETNYYIGNSKLGCSKWRGFNV